MMFDISKVKIFVAVPEGATEKVRDAMCRAGAGVIGNYSYCTCTVKSLGTFIPNENANPTIGENNKLEFVKEEKLEAVANVSDVKSILKAIREVHPYEEPAIDIVPLLDENLFS